MMRNLGNIGLVSYANRKIGKLNDYQALLPAIGKLEFTDPVIVSDGDVDATLREMKNIVRRHYKETAALAKTLEAGSVKETARRIWDFVYGYIKYEPDSKLFEQLRIPLRTLYDQAGDCDCYSILIGSMLYSLGIPFKFRVARYNQPQWQHVYVVVPSGNTEIIIDPVVESFNYEKPTPSKDKKDYSMAINGLNGMPIQMLNGMGEASNGTDYKALVDVIIANDLEQQFSGLGTADDAKAIYDYLVKTREAIASNPESIKSYQNTADFLKMIDYAIEHWNTPNRDKALEILEAEEQRLIDSGAIILQGITPEDHADLWQVDEGFSGTENEDPEFDYYYHNPWQKDTSFTGTEAEEPGKVYDYEYQDEWKNANELSGFNLDDLEFRELNGIGIIARKRNPGPPVKVAAAATQPKAVIPANKLPVARNVKKETPEVRAKSPKKKGGFFKRVGAAIKKGGKASIQAVVRFNPLSITARAGLLAAIRLNIGKMADNLQYGLMTEAQATEKGYDLASFKQHQEAYKKALNMFTKTMKGQKSHFDNMIKKGRKTKLFGFSGLGVVAEAAAITTATPFIVKVGSFFKKLNPVKIIKKIKAARDIKKAANAGTALTKATNIFNKAKAVVNKASDMVQAAKGDNAVMPDINANNAANDTDTNSKGSGGKSTGFFNSAMDFVKLNPGKTTLAVVAGAFIVSPKLRASVGNMFRGSRAPSKPAPALSGIKRRHLPASKAKGSHIPIKHHKIKSIELK